MHFQVKAGRDEVRFLSLVEKADGVPHLTMSHEVSGASAMTSSVTSASGTS